MNTIKCSNNDVSINVQCRVQFSCHSPHFSNSINIRTRGVTLPCRPAPCPCTTTATVTSLIHWVSSVLICGVTKQPQHHGRILSGHRAPSVIRCRDTHTAPSFIVLVQSRVVEMFSLKTVSNSSKSSEQLLCKRSKYSRSPMKYKIVYLVESFV